MCRPIHRLKAFDNVNHNVDYNTILNIVNSYIISGYL